MAYIQTCPKTQVRNNEWLTACKTIRDKILENNAGQLLFKTQFDGFTFSIVEMENSSLKYSVTEFVLKSNAAKRQSNNTRMSLFNKIKSESKRTNAVKSAAGKTLLGIVKNHQNITGLPFKNLIAETDLILTEFNSDTYKEAVNTLGFEDHVEELNTINNECKEILSKKLVITGKHKSKRKVEDTRRELNISYDLLVDELNFLARKNGDEDYLDLFNFWNALIDELRASINARLGAKRGGKMSDSEINTSDPTHGTPDSGGGEDDRPVIE